MFIGWGPPVRGRESKSLDVFSESVQFWGKLQQDGRIESFDVVLLNPNGGGITGYMEIHGSAAQIAGLDQDEEFVRNTVDASLIVEDGSEVEQSQTMSFLPDEARPPGPVRIASTWGLPVTQSTTMSLSAASS